MHKCVPTAARTGGRKPLAPDSDLGNIKGTAKENWKGEGGWEDKWNESGNAKLALGGQQLGKQACTNWV